MPSGVPKRLERARIAGESSPKTILHMIFEDLGGYEAALQWARKQPDKFYRDLFFKMSPAYKHTDQNIAKGGGNHRDHHPQTISKVSIKKFGNDD